MQSIHKVELIYLAESGQFHEHFELTAPTRIVTLIEQSELLQQFPELSLDTMSVGIFSKKATLDTVLQDGDRVEVYRELTIDPKEARRLRSKSKTS